MRQEPLFDPPPVEVALTERQAFVLRELRAAGEGGLDADEIGAALCERKGRHDRGVRCSWDGANGKSVLNSLRKKGLVRRRRGGTWLALVEGEEEQHEAEGPGELLDGF